MKSQDAPDAVERRLQEEALALRAVPQFSPLLHERIMQSLRDCGLPVNAPAPRPRLTFWRVAIPAGVAAAIALGAWLALRPTQPPVSRQRVAKSPDTLPQLPVPQLPSGTTDIATSALERGKYAYLDRDANRLLTFVADQIPSLPQPK